MNLMTKFAILVFMLTCMMVIAVGIPAWAVATVDRNVVRNQGALVNTILNLKQIENATQAVLNRKRADDGSIRTSSKFIRNQFSDLADLTSELADSPNFHSLAGASLGTSLLHRLNEIGQIVAQLETEIETAANLTGTPNSPANINIDVTQNFTDLNILVSMIRKQLENNVYYSIQHSAKIRTLIRNILVSTSIAAALVALLSFLLLRRWVITPILALRQAAREIGQGHFDYRVAINSGDEIGALSQEVNHMAATIATMQSQVVARERLHAIEEILRRIVHNLRNPLAGIRGLAEATCLDLPMDSRTRDDQGLIIKTVDRFEKWLNELLHSTASLRINPLSDSPTDLMQMVIQTVQPLATSKSIDLTLITDTAPTDAFFDPMHLEHALVALTTNALEASEQGTRVRITATAIQPIHHLQLPSERWHISIEDSGAGVPKERRTEIFLPYYTTKSKGTGLGLALVQNVITAHQGTVTVTDSELGGAKFDIDLPTNHTPQSKTSNRISNGVHHG